MNAWDIDSFTMTPAVRI